MNNNTGHIISTENDAPPVAFIKWPLDMDDDEFRAGYPFTPVPLEEVNEHKTWHVGSSTSNDASFHSVNSQNDHFNRIAKEDNETSRFPFREQKELVKFDVKSSAVHNDNTDYNANLNQQQGHEEDKRKQYDQYSIVATNNVKDKQTNQAHPAI